MAGLNNKSTFRLAMAEDIDDIVALLANDKLGVKRENVNNKTAYQQAFNIIETDPHAELWIMLYGSRIIGSAQLNYLHYLTYQGGVRAQIEAVRIHTDFRGQGLGRYLFEFLIQQAKDKDCHLIQLTTDKQRPDAYQFYEQLGFVASHDGFKLFLG